MGVLRQVPKVEDLEMYAGDTYTVAVVAPTAFIAGRVWTVQVRASRDAADADASFVVVPATEPDGMTFMYLRAADTARLATLAAGGTGKFVSTSGGGRYSGVWDMQLAPAGGGDPTTTVVTGSVTIFADVTRSA